MFRILCISLLAVPSTLATRQRRNAVDHDDRKLDLDVLKSTKRERELGRGAAGLVDLIKDTGSGRFLARKTHKGDINKVVDDLGKSPYIVEFYGTVDNFTFWEPCRGGSLQGVSEG